MKGITIKRIRLILLPTLPAVAMFGCSTPFSGDSNAIDWEAETRKGTIAVSDPKLYRREALIDERRKDVEWIDKLIEESKTVEFKPEILREIETISAFSAALGLKFDPAAAVSYKNAGETGELKQQIDTLKLQLQLDQLKRDAELVRSQFESQSKPANPDVSILSTDTSPSTNDSGIAATEQLKAAIERLTSATYDFNKEVKGIAKASAAISPLDDFKDRQAYRNMLKAARNAASLDELHDWDGSALLRLSFQATVVPDADKSDVPGVIQMRIAKPDMDSTLTNKFFLGWLNYINRHINIRVNEDFIPNADLRRSALADNFQIVHYLYTTSPSPSIKAQCKGLVSDENLHQHAACKSLILFAPLITNTVLGGKAYMRFTDDIDLMLYDNDNDESQKDINNRQLIRSIGDKLVKNCNFISEPTSVPSEKKTESLKLQRALLDAKIHAASGNHYIVLDGIARDILRSHGVEAPTNDTLHKVKERTARAKLLRATFVQTIMTNCSQDQRVSFEQDLPTIYLTPAAHQILWGEEGRVSIYETGPRELTQQMSTVSRSANSLGLALSIAASEPGSGIAAEAAAGYSRQAMGRADALERLPSVIGYSVSSSKTFGWVLGPKATIDPKGKINLDQPLRTYDLTVDLTVPGWWPYFSLETLTAWAPDRVQLVNGEIPQILVPNNDQSESQRHLSHTIKVPMSPNSADYSSITKLLASSGFQFRYRDTKIPIDEVFSNQMVSACRPSTIVLRGDFLWRAHTVIIGGVKISGGAVSVMPDMSGIIVDVPPLDEKIIGRSSKTQVTVLTPYGPSSLEVLYDKPDEGCKKAEAKPDPDIPSISDYQPKSFQLPGLVILSVKGEKLNKIKSVTLGGIPGEIVAQNDKSLTVKFLEDTTKILLPSNAVVVSFAYENADKKTKTVDKAVTIVANWGGGK